MSCLLYCIFRQSPASTELCQGIQGRSVELVSQCGLTAVISHLAQPATPADLAWLIVYQRVVDFFHHRQTLIPMRYGAVFASQAAVRQFLEKRRQDYLDLLQELKGCVEMGVRIVYEKHPAAPAEEQSAKPYATMESPADSGKSYLEQRQTHYALADHSTERSKALLESVRTGFAGLYIKSKMELDASRIARQISKASMVSLYFLISGASVPAFRRNFARLNREHPVQLLLSGPWPPYNFVN